MANVYHNLAATTAAVTNRIVTSTNMVVGTYTIANASPVWSGGALITLTHTTATGADTLGTVTLVGKDLAGQTITEVLTPVADSTVTSTKIFRSVTSATGAGWVINGGNDTIVIGVAAGDYMAGSGGVLHALVINVAAAATVVISDKQGTIATIPASQAAGTEFIYDVGFTGFLKVATTSTNDVTVIHSGTVPTAYATA
jgi:hypothetical protein